MQDNPSTNPESDNSYPDAEDWQIVLEPYFAHPEAALGLARCFAAIREYLKRTPPEVLRTVDALDLAIEALFEHTRFQSGAFDLYQSMIEGHADRAHETLAESLGVKL
jgi:hypothetical protein